MNRANDDHQNRVKQELISAGVTKYGLLKSEARYLHHVIRADESIHGVVYGQFGDGSAMLVATSSRLIFLDCKPFFVSTDDISYNVVSGIRMSSETILATLTLHSRLGDYIIRYVNKKCAQIFIDYVEGRIFENKQQASKNNSSLTIDTPNNQSVALSSEELEFLTNHHTAVLSTIDRSGHLRGTVIHYVVIDNQIFFMSKSETKKIHNLLHHTKSAITIYDEIKVATMQLEVEAEIIAEQNLKNQVFESIHQMYKSRNRLPPMASLTKGAFIVLRLNIETITYRSYS